MWRKARRVRGDPPLAETASSGAPGNPGLVGMTGFSGEGKVVEQFRVRYTVE